MTMAMASNDDGGRTWALDLVEKSVKRKMTSALVFLCLGGLAAVYALYDFSMMLLLAGLHAPPVRTLVYLLVAVLLLLAGKDFRPALFSAPRDAAAYRAVASDPASITELGTLETRTRSGVYFSVRMRLRSGEPWYVRVASREEAQSLLACLMRLSPSAAPFRG